MGCDKQYLLLLNNRIKIFGIWFYFCRILIRIPNIKLNLHIINLVTVDIGICNHRRASPKFNDILENELKKNQNSRLHTILTVHDPRYKMTFFKKEYIKSKNIWKSENFTLTKKVMKVVAIVFRISEKILIMNRKKGTKNRDLSFWKCFEEIKAKIQQQNTPSLLIYGVVLCNL